MKADFAGATDWFQRAWTDGPQRQPAQVDPAVRERVRAMVLEGLQPGKDDWPVLTPDPPAIGRLGEIRAPVLAILGGIDMPEIIDIVGRIEKEVPGARKAIFARAAHMVNMEEPERFNRVVLEFLGR